MPVGPSLDPSVWYFAIDDRGGTLYRPQQDGTAMVRSSSGVPGAWQVPAYTNSWVDFGGGYAPMRYRRNSDKTELYGALKSGANGTTAFTLPVGYRPAEALFGPIVTSGGIGYLTISAAGLVAPTQLTGAIVNGAFAPIIAFPVA